MKDIKGYEGLYAVTSCGKVWSYRSKKFLKPGKVGKGYLKVWLQNKGQKEYVYIHKLVAEAYLPNPLNFSEIDHIDGDKTNNSIGNLQWISREENVQKACGTSVICVEDNISFRSMRAAARYCGGDHHGIDRAINSGEIYKGYHWKLN